MAFSPNDFYGGPNMYNPAMGLAMVQNPELIAAHLASLGHEPPDDISGNPDHVDAKHSLGRALAFNTSQGNPFAPGEEIMPRNALPLVGGDAIQNPPPPFAPPDAMHPSDADMLSGLPSGKGVSLPSFGGGPARSAPNPNPLAPPTPAPESAAATGAAPAENTQETPGQDIPLPRDRPSSAPQGDVATTSGSGKKQPLDDLAMALSGLKGMPYSNPLHIYSPQAPRPSNMIARNTTPAVLMQEMAAAGRPTSTFRLGEALRGRVGQ